MSYERDDRDLLTMFRDGVGKGLRVLNIRSREAYDTLRIKKDQFLQMLRDLPQMPLEIMRELAVRLNNVNKELSAAHAKLRAAGLE